MKIDWRLQRILLGHLLLSIFFFWYFTHYSFLRPLAEPGTECFLALLIEVAAEINFWILYPLCQNKNRFFLYFVLSAVEIIALSVVEYFLTIDANLSKFQLIELPDNECFQFKISLFTNLIFRNLGLFCFIMIMAYNTDLRIRLFEKDRKLFRLKKQLIVQSLTDKQALFLDADQICYIQQDQNLNHFYTFDGQHFIRRSSLMDLQQLLGEENYLKISKSVIVSKPHIKGLAEDVITLQTDQHTEEYQLKIGKSYLSEVVPVIKTVLKKNIHDLNKTGNQPSEPPLPGLHPKAFAIYQYILTCPESKIPDIVEGTKIPKSTVTRYLKELQEEGLIEYTGSKKTGGYRVVNTSREAGNAGEVQ